MVVPGCPVIGHAVAVAPPTSQQRTRKVPPPVQTREKIILTGNGLTTARVNQQAEFVIDATDAAPGRVPSDTQLLCGRSVRPQHGSCPSVRRSVRPVRVKWFNGIALRGKPISELPAICDYTELPATRHR